MTAADDDFVTTDCYRGKKRLEKNLEAAKNDLSELSEKLLKLQTGNLHTLNLCYGLVLLLIWNGSLSFFGDITCHFHEYQRQITL